MSGGSDWESRHLGDRMVGQAARPTGTTRCQRVAAYGLAPDTPEPEIVAHLFKLYAEKTAKHE